LVCCCSDIASQQQDEIDDALKMGVLRSSGHSYLWVRFRVLRFSFLKSNEKEEEGRKKSFKSCMNFCGIGTL